MEHWTCIKTSVLEIWQPVSRWIWLWTAVFKPQVWHYGCCHLRFLEPQVTISVIYCLFYSKWQHALKNEQLCQRRLEPRDWHHKLIRRQFTEVINQVRSGVIFSHAHIQPEFFMQPMESPPSGGLKALLHWFHFFRPGGSILIFR